MIESDMLPGDYRFGSSGTSNVSAETTEYIKLRIKPSWLNIYFNEDGSCSQPDWDGITFPSQDPDTVSVLAFCSGSVITVPKPDSEGYVEIYVEKTERKAILYASFKKDYITFSGSASYNGVIYDRKECTLKGKALSADGTLLLYVPAGNYKVKMSNVPEAYQAKEPVTVTVTDSSEIQKLSIKLEDAHEHVYSSDYKYDETNHWKECACGDKANVASHTPGPEATETSPQVCTVCGYEIAPIKQHEHVYSSEYKNDETNHWKECACGDKANVASHTPGPEATETSPQVCTVCGYEIAPVKDHEHVYSNEYKSDETKHWKECACGDKANVASHTPGPEATETSPQVCTVCGYEIAPIKQHEHVYSSEYKNDATNHWKECACGDKANVEEHVWTWVTDKEATYTQEGSKHEVCSVCGYEKSAVTIPVIDAPQTGDQSNVVLFCLLAAAAAAVMTGVVVYEKKRIHDNV